MRNRFRFLVPFGSGVAVAALVLGLSGTFGSYAATRYEDLNLFTNVLSLVRKNYVEPIDERALIQGAVRGMLEALDPHSSYLTPEIYKEMQIDTRGEFAGLGIEIAKRRDGFIEVVSPIDGTPAHSAGIRARDQIVAICPTEKPEDWSEDCRSTKSMTLIEAVRLMRGPKGTKVTIRIHREEFESPQPYSIVRDVVKIESTDGRMLEPGYGYVRIRAFQERTGEDLNDILANLRKENSGELKGVVLDLRDNPGGLLDQAVKVADTWLTDGLVVYTKGRLESQRQDFRAHEEASESAYPMVVLVNAGSASASEIVAGALQDQNRALVLGTPTFGKGSVQTIIPLEDGSGLRLTTALYYTPNDRSIQEVGIAPDIIVERREIPKPEADDRPRRIRERDLERHFTQEEADPDSDESVSDDDDPQNDLQLSRAMEVLKSWTYFEQLRERRQNAGNPAIATQIP